MDNVAPILIVGILVWGVYRIFELFVRRNERMAIIEKMSDNTIPTFSNSVPKTSGWYNTQFSSVWALRAGLLLVGIGLGLGVALLLETLFFPQTIYPEFNGYDFNVQSNIRNTINVLYFACISLFGGLGLLAAYLLEQKKEKQNKADKISA